MPALPELCLICYCWNRNVCPVSLGRDPLEILLKFVSLFQNHSPELLLPSNIIPDSSRPGWGSWSSHHPIRQSLIYKQVWTSLYAFIHGITKYVPPQCRCREQVIWGSHGAHSQSVKEKAEGTLHSTQAGVAHRSAFYRNANTVTAVLRCYTIATAKHSSTSLQSSQPEPNTTNVLCIMHVVFHFPNTKLNLLHHK